MEDRFWQLFQATGAPEAYLLYRRMNEVDITSGRGHVSANQRSGDPGSGIQRIG